MSPRKWRGQDLADAITMLVILLLLAAALVLALVLVFRR